MIRSLFVILCLTLTMSRVARGDDAKDDAKSMNGTWLPSAAELAGEKFPDEVRKAIKLVIAGGKYTAMVGKKL